MVRSSFYRSILGSIINAYYYQFNRNAIFNSHSVIGCSINRNLRMVKMEKTENTYTGNVTISSNNFEMHYLNCCFVKKITVSIIRYKNLYSNS